MQVSLRHKFAFLCNPKCASTSIEIAIRRHCDIQFSGHPSLKHLSARQFERHIRPLLGKVDPNGLIETFCLMREPVSRVRSWYLYRRRAEIADSSHSNHKRHTGGMSFAEFVRAYLEGGDPRTSGVGAQAGFVGGGENGRVLVNRIFRMDQMDEVADYLSSRIGKPVAIEVHNKTPADREAVDLDLPPELEERLRERLSADFKIYEQLPLHSPRVGRPTGG